MDLNLRTVSNLTAINKSNKPTIIIMDDYIDFADIFTMLLRDLGYQTFQAYNGYDGLQLAHAVHPSVIFCDIGLPDINGIEIAKKLKSDHCFNNTYLVAMSGSRYCCSDDIDTYFDRFVSKPIRTSVIQEILNREIPRFKEGVS
jgi:CheY-like chemotaxis protein